MKKILIVTLYGNNNFGNKLQNYALQETIKNINKNFSVETQVINYEKISNNIFIIFIWRIYNFVKNLFLLKDSRKDKFLEFSNQYINYSKKSYSINSKKKIDNYDFYVYGSDQVWNPNGTGKSDIYLGFLTDNNISYAASLSSDLIPDSQKLRYRSCLNKFKFISVREDKGKNLLKELLPNKNIEVLVDPTMLLNKEDWNVISKKTDKSIPNKYILNYFLGTPSNEIVMEINRIASEYKCEIINILDKNDPFYNSGPSEFLYLEKNAFLICTDSFHSSVFAILYDRPFIVFERNSHVSSMYSRIDTLLNKFKIKNRKYNGKYITEDNLKHDYTEAYKVLEKERKKSEEFLKKALDVNN